LTPERWQKVSPRTLEETWRIIVSSGPTVPRKGRKRRSRELTFSGELNERLDELKDAGENLSAIAEEALRAHPKVAMTQKDKEQR
jgi:hypothetical protein